MKAYIALLFLGFAHEVQHVQMCLWFFHKHVGSVVLSNYPHYPQQALRSRALLVCHNYKSTLARTKGKFKERGPLTESYVFLRGIFVTIVFWLFLLTVYGSALPSFLFWLLHNYFFKTTVFQSNFRFTGKLSRRYCDFPYNPLSLHMHRLPHCRHPAPQRCICYN